MSLAPGSVNRRTPASLLAHLPREPEAASDWDLNFYAKSQSSSSQWCDFALLGSGSTRGTKRASPFRAQASVLEAMAREDAAEEAREALLAGILGLPTRRMILSSAEPHMLQEAIHLHRVSERSY